MVITHTRPLAPFDPFAPEVVADPHPYYARLRRETPVAWSEALQCWLVARYDDVWSVVKNPADFSSARGVASDRYRTDRPQPTMINSDPPEHNRFRGLVAKAFTTRSIAALEPKIQEIASDLLDAVQRTGRIDVAQDLAIPLPVITIAEILGIPREDRERFKHWSDAVAESIGQEDRSRVIESRREFADYLRQIMAERRQHPRDDLVSSLVTLAESEHQPLTEEEVIAMCNLLLIAGNETTTNLIGAGTDALLQHPDELARAQEGRVSVRTLVEECLRFVSPVFGLFRTTTREVELGGARLGADERVFVCYGSANRDEAHFDEPDRLRIDRSPNDHVAFGQGPHFCLGAPLARLEARTAFAAMLQRLPGIRFDPEQPKQKTASPLLRGYKNLPLLFDEGPKP